MASVKGEEFKQYRYNGRSLNGIGKNPCIFDTEKTIKLFFALIVELVYTVVFSVLGTTIYFDIIVIISKAVAYMHIFLRIAQQL